MRGKGVRTTVIEPDRSVIAAFLTGAGKMRHVEFATLMGWTPPTEASRRARGFTPRFTKIGNAIFYSFADIAEWLARNENVPFADTLAARDLVIEKPRGKRGRPRKHEVAAKLAALTGNAA